MYVREQKVLSLRNNPPPVHLPFPLPYMYFHRLTCRPLPCMSLNVRCRADSNPSLSARCFKSRIHNHLPHVFPSIESDEPRSRSTREVHIRCILERSLQLLHRLRNFGISRLDVAVLRYRHMGVPQDSLDGFVGNSKTVKIRR